MFIISLINDKFVVHLQALDTIKLLLADKHALSSAGFKTLISQKEDVLLAGEISGKQDLAEALINHQPTLLVVDYTIDGFLTIEDLEIVKQTSPSTEILVLSPAQDKGKILRVLQLGVKGYLTKECSKEEIIMAIYAVAKGEKFYCHKVLDVIMEQHFPPAEEDCEPTLLTNRETEILIYLAKGKNTQQIASDLYLSPHTVHTHRKSIIKKLSIKSPTEFVVRAMDLGLLKA